MEKTIKEHEKLYLNVLHAIDNFTKLEPQIVKLRKANDVFCQLVKSNAKLISEFISVEIELLQYINNFSTSTPLDFNTGINIITPLTHIKENLELMKRKMDFPLIKSYSNNTECVNLLDNCRSLVIFINTKMTSADYNRVETKLIGYLSDLENLNVKLEADFAAQKDREKADFVKFVNLLINDLTQNAHYYWQEDNGSLIIELRTINHNKTIVSLEPFHTKALQNKQKKTQDIENIFVKRFILIPYQYRKKVENEIRNKSISRPSFFEWIDTIFYQAIDEIITEIDDNCLYWVEDNELLIKKLKDLKKMQAKPYFSFDGLRKRIIQNAEKKKNEIDNKIEEELFVLSESKKQLIKANFSNRYVSKKTFLETIKGMKKDIKLGLIGIWIAGALIASFALVCGYYYIDFSKFFEKPKDSHIEVPAAEPKPIESEISDNEDKMQDTNSKQEPIKPEIKPQETKKSEPPQQETMARQNAENKRLALYYYQEYQKFNYESDLNNAKSYARKVQNWQNDYELEDIVNTKHY